MSYFPKKGQIFAYNNDSILFDCGPNKDCYALITCVYIDIETDAIIYKAEVVINWHYDAVPKTGAVEGKKYKEVLTSDTVKQCLEFIHNIVQAKGYWDRDPDKPFEKIFIPPTI